MKKVIAILALGCLHAVSANAAGKVGQCVYPKTKIAKNGNLQFQNATYIFSEPKATSSGQLLSSLSAFTIKAEKGSYIQLATVPNYDRPDPDKSAGKIIGWAKLSDFRLQDLRNCQ